MVGTVMAAMQMQLNSSGGVALASVARRRSLQFTLGAAHQVLGSPARRRAVTRRGWGGGVVWRLSAAGAGVTAQLILPRCGPSRPASTWRSGWRTKMRCGHTGCRTTDLLATEIMSGG